jgi:outer membrane protein assembly factor BamB
VIHGATAPLPASRITNRRWLADDAPGAAVANGDLILHPGAPDSIIARDAATGTERWRTVVGAPVTGVVLREDAAIVLAGDRLRRLDLATGTEAWQATAAGAVVPPLVGGGMALVQGQDGLAALALADGREHWRVPVAAGPVAPVRLRCGDDDLVATPDGRVLRIADGNLVATGLPVAAFHLGTGARLFTIAADGILTATGLREGTAGPTVATLWTVAMATPVGQPLLTEGRLFVPAGTAIVVLDPATGTERGRLALTASLSAPPLAAAGHLWLPGAGGPETTVVATLDAAPVEVWRYTTAGGARLPLFTSGGVILRAGGQLHALLGPAPQEPLALDPVEIPATDRPADLQPFASDILPERWLWAGPIPGKDPDQDHLADLGGRSRAAIAENSKFTVAGREFSFVPLPDTGLVCNQYTGNRPVIELVRIHGKVWNTTGYYTTTIDNDAERLVRFASLLPGGRPWPARLDLRCYLDGIPIDERLPLRLGPGRHRLLIAAGIGQCEDWGMIFMVPRFIDGGEALAAEVVRNRQARDDWRRYQAEEAGKPFLLP